MKEVISTYQEKLDKIFDIKDWIKDIYSPIDELYPIAIVDEGNFYIFDYMIDNSVYELVKIELTKFPIPKGVRAAFELESYDNKIRAVIFHEFVHCFQFNTCELKLKQVLSIDQEYLKKKNFMWEIKHSFPYDDIEVNEHFQKYVTVLNSRNLTDLIKVRKNLLDFLDKNDIEYFIWQEWKEGFARYVKIELEKN